MTSAPPTPPTMPVCFSDAYTDTGVAFDTFRKAGAIAASLQRDPIPGVALIEPSPVGRDDLCTVHDAGYVDAVLSGAPRELAASNELGWDEGLARAVCASTGGVVAAALGALGSGRVGTRSPGRIAGSLSSGLHHAHPGHGRGYCTVNGLAVAAVAAVGAGARRVLILDLDAHCGGGTAAILAGLAGPAGRSRRDPGIEQVDVSVDEFDTYESRPGARLTMTDGPGYLAAIESALAGIDDPSGIDLVLYNAGVDPHHRAGGVAGIDDTVIAQREEMVFAWTGAHRLPVAWVLAGGYIHGVETKPGVDGTDLAGLVALHRITIEAAAAASR